MLIQPVACGRGRPLTRAASRLPTRRELPLESVAAFDPSHMHCDAEGDDQRRETMPSKLRGLRCGLASALQLVQDALATGADGANELERLLRLEGIGEEELEHADVPHVEKQGLRCT